MTNKYELLTGDCSRVGDRIVYRIRAFRDFGDIRREDLGGYIEKESALAHDGHAWVQDMVQNVYGALFRNSILWNGTIATVPLAKPGKSLSLILSGANSLKPTARN